MGAISQTFPVLGEVSLGYHFVETGLILRESTLLSKMLLSSESWHKLFQYQIEKLEEVDHTFFRKLLNCHSKTGIEFLFSETGTIPIKIKIRCRRLMYWWHILNVEETEMINKVYRAQKLSPVSGDWVLLIEEDKQMFNIKMADDEVKAVSKYKFTNFVKKKAKELTIEYLMRLKQKHSKSTDLDVQDLSISPYLIDGRFSKESRELLFKLRSKTVDVKENFKNAHFNNHMLCELCLLFPCTQSHPLQCPQLNIKLVVDKKLMLSGKYFFALVDKKLLYVNIYKQFWELRETTLSRMKDDESCATT